VWAVTLFELVLAAFTAWALLRSDLAGHGEGATVNVLAVTAIGACLVAFVFLLALWQWRVGPVTRLRILLVTFGSLVWCFCSLGWYDIAVASARMPRAAAREWLREQSLAAGVSMGVLPLGLAVVGIALWLERRALKARGQHGIMNCVQ